MSYVSVYKMVLSPRDDGHGLVGVSVYIDVLGLCPDDKVNLLRSIDEAIDVQEKVPYRGDAVAVQLALPSAQPDGILERGRLDEVHLLPYIHEHNLVAWLKPQHLYGKGTQGYPSISVEHQATFLETWLVDHHKLTELVCVCNVVNIHSSLVCGARNGSNRSRHPGCVLSRIP